MSNLEDEQFESYLKKFRPLEPTPLPAEVHARPRRQRRLKLAGLSLLATSALALGILMLHFRANQSVRAPGHAPQSSGEHRVNSRPLTLGVANRLLSDSPSLETALDSLGAEAVTPAIPQSKKSALAVLSEENIRP